MSSLEIAEKLGNINARTIRKKLKKFGIPTRSLSEALTKKLKRPFLNNLNEKAYFLGLRAGDFYAKWIRKSIRVQTTTTHLAQIGLLKNAFKNYGETRVYLMKNKSSEGGWSGNEWFAYVDLHPSFQFLLKKPNKIADWILKDTKNSFNS